MIRDAKTLHIISMKLWCDICKTWTDRIFNDDGTHMDCSCGETTYFFENRR